MRPHEDDTTSMRDAVLWQRDYVRGHGAPIAGEILDAVAENLAAEGSLAALLPEVVRFGDLPGLRIMATVHRLALERQAPEVALALPTLGGSADVLGVGCARFRTAVIDCLVDHPVALAEGLAQTPQTNETGRAALLRSALAREASGDPWRPVRLWEIGTSAGLNLRADHLPGIAALEPGPLPTIIERRGCDRAPVDIATIDGRLLLSSYVWVDDVERFQRLAAALDVAAEVPAEIVQMDAADFVRDLSPASGECTVLWHSAMWVYLPVDVRESVLAEIARAGGEARPDAPLLHVSWEWDSAHDGPEQFALIVRRWDGVDQGQPMLLARGMSHGRAIVACDPPVPLERDLVTVG